MDLEQWAREKLIGRPALEGTRHSEVFRSRTHGSHSPSEESAAALHVSHLHLLK